MINFLRKLIKAKSKKTKVITIIANKREVETINLRKRRKTPPFVINNNKTEQVASTSLSVYFRDVKGLIPTSQKAI